MELLKNNSNGLQPILKFVKKSSFSSLLLFFSAFAALVLANTPANVYIEAFLYKTIGFTIGNFELYKNTQLWINDGLMSIFFFVIGLELKREIIAGQLSNIKNIYMPMVAAIGGMVLPAFIYYLFNNQGSAESLNGWGIPMATDIAFALGVLYLLGPKVPIQLKVFLTALAIIDDIGAVLVVAIFYTSEILVFNLTVAMVFLGLLFLLSKLGVRNVLVFAVIGIIGVWLPFLLSGIHATIAAVLVAFAIPATRAIDKEKYLEDLKQLMAEFKMAKKSEKEFFLLSPKEENIIGEIQRISLESISPLQRLERNMHGLVLFVVMPIFALANAGVEIESDWAEMISSPVSLGIIVGLIGGKIIGVFGLSMLGLKLGLYKMPENLNTQMVLGASFLAAIGFTMALFINSLAFENYVYLEQAKMGILLASFLSGWLGYFFIKKAIAHR